MPDSTHPDRHNPSLAEQGARKKERKRGKRAAPGLTRPFSVLPFRSLDPPPRSPPPPPATFNQRARQPIKTNERRTERTISRKIARRTNYESNQVGVSYELARRVGITDAFFNGSMHFGGHASLCAVMALGGQQVRESLAWFLFSTVVEGLTIICMTRFD